MNTLKRFLAMCLCLCMLMPIAGCGSKDSGAAGSGAAAADGFVYTAEFKELTGSIGNVGTAGSRLYYLDWSGGENSVIKCLDMNTLTSEEIPFALQEQESVSSIQALEDGSLALLLSIWSENDQRFLLVKLDAAGTENLRQDITQLVNGGGSGDMMSGYPQSMQIDADGNIYILVSGMEEKVLVLDAQGSQLFEVASQGWSHGMCRSGDGRVFLLSYDDSASGYVLQYIDPKAKGFGESLKGIPDANGNVLCSAAGEKEIWISCGNSLYRYDLEAKTCEQILNWINSDVNSDQLQALGQLEDGRIFALTSDYTQTGQTLEAVYLTKTPASEVKQKTVITYATMYLDYNVRAQLIRFNKTNDTWRIEVKEYGNGNYEDGLAQLNSDIVSGNPPDLINLSNMNVENYISKGILADLYPLMEQDSTLKKEDFVENALRIYEQDGKLYGICPTFTVMSLAGKAEDVGGRDGWTVADVQSLLASKPAGTELIEYASREGILSILVSMGLDSYVDWAAGSCSFNSEEFLALLEFASQFPAQETVTYEDSEGTYEKIKEGKLLLDEISVYSIQDYLYHDAVFEGQMACIGFPTNDGSTGSYLNGTQSLGIAEKSPHKDGAWAFISTLLSEEYQDALDTMNGLALRASSLEKQYAKAMEQKEGDFGAIISSGDFTYEVKAATQEQIDALRHLIDTARPTKNTDTEIMNIITEEAGPYFAGQKTAQEAADIIQSRVQIYISENQ